MSYTDRFDDDPQSVKYDRSVAPTQIGGVYVPPIYSMGGGIYDPSIEEDPANAGSWNHEAITDREDDRNQYVLTFPMPGYSRESVKIKWEADTNELLVTASPLEEFRRYIEPFETRFQFSRGIIKEQIRPKYTAGVLRVILPYKPVEDSGQYIPLEEEQ